MGWGILALELVHACSWDFSCTPYSCIPIFLNVYLFMYVRLGEHHFGGLTNPDVNRKRMHQLFCYMTLSLYSTKKVKEISENHAT